MDPDSKRTPGSGARPGGRGTAPARVAVTDGRGRPLPDTGLARWLAALIPARVRGDLAIALVGDRHIRTLNRTYRGVDAATDVLSFPAGDGDTFALPHLGDIVIATGVAKRQAREAGHAYATELRVLALHGLLHLLGYDHEDPADRGRMARAEARLRRAGGLREGLIARAQNAPAARPSGRRAAPRRGAREVARAGVGPRAQKKR